MFQNLITRWTIILSVIFSCIYFLLPTFNLYTIKNDPDFQDIDTKYLEEDAIKLGLDLQGGLYTVLELDYKTYLLNYLNSTISIQDKIKFSNILGLTKGSSPCTFTIISPSTSIDASATLSVPVKQESDVSITL